jgi:hypothetical protein
MSCRSRLNEGQVRVFVFAGGGFRVFGSRDVGWMGVLLILCDSLSSKKTNFSKMQPVTTHIPVVRFIKRSVLRQIKLPSPDPHQSYFLVIIRHIPSYPVYWPVFSAREGFKPQWLYQHNKWCHLMANAHK